MLVCMCWCVLYVYVCKWTQQTARTHAWDARTHAYMYSTHGLLSRSPTPVSCQRENENRPTSYTTPLYLGRYLHARISPLDTLYIYGDSLTSEAEHKQVTRQAGQARLSCRRRRHCRHCRLSSLTEFLCTRTYLVLATTHVRTSIPKDQSVR